MQAEGKPIELRGGNKVSGVEEKDGFVALSVDTPDGPYTLEADWLIACDGANSPIRAMLGLDFVGRVFEDNFLIADIVMEANSNFPTERWFWFDPPFNRGQSVLLHKQPDNVWRIDFQLGWDIDKEEEKKPENVTRRLQAMLGEECEVRARMDLDLHLPVPPHGAFPPRPGDLCRRFGPPGLALRRARRQFRPSGHRQPGLEAEARHGRQGARQPARHL